MSAEPTTFSSIAIEDTNHLRDFILDNLTQRPEVAHLGTRIVFEHIRKPAIAPLGCV